MSKERAVKELIIEILSDGDVHTADEIRKKAHSRGLIEKESSTSTRNAIYNLKKENSNFKVVKKGEYRLENIHDGQNDESVFEKSIMQIEEEMKLIKKLNWYACSDQELNNARKKVVKLKDLAMQIDKYFG